MNRKRKNDESLKERVEDFLYSDKKSAKIANVALAIIFMAGILAVIATAPNIFQIFGRKYRRTRNYNSRQFQKSIYYLKRKGLVKFIKESGDKITVRITHKGRKKLVEYSIDEMEIKKPKKWDKKWRIVVFDIPNKYKKARDALREKLKDLEFYQLQKSVWVFPFSCFDEVLFVAHVFKVERFIEILTVEEMINDTKLRCHFDLEFE